jgi:hypothetical protein
MLDDRIPILHALMDRVRRRLNTFSFLSGHFSLLLPFNWSSLSPLREKERQVTSDRL